MVMNGPKNDIAFGFDKLIGIAIDTCSHILTVNHLHFLLCLLLGLALNNFSIESHLTCQQDNNLRLLIELQPALFSVLDTRVKGNGDYLVEVLMLVEFAEEGMKGEEELDLLYLCLGPVSAILAEDLENGHRCLIIILQA